MTFVLMVTVLESINTKHFHNHRTSYWIAIEFDSRAKHSNKDCDAWGETERLIDMVVQQGSVKRYPLKSPMTT